jgi:hypothetical protein
MAFVAGLFFLGVAAISGFGGLTLSTHRGWALPALLIGVGVIGLLCSLVLTAKGRHEDT